MGWSLPRDWVAGEICTASIFNTHIRDNERYLKGLDGAVTVGADLTVNNLITAGVVDGVDVSVHKAGTAYTQHTAGAGDHTHQSTGAQGGILDHGLALTGLTDDDHTQYPLKSLLTTEGDIIYATGASTWARLAKGTAVQFLRMNAALTAPEWASITGATTVRKTANEIVNNSSTLQNDDHLLFAVGANQIWEFYANIIITTVTGVPDWKWDWTLPTSGVLEYVTSEAIGITTSFVGTSFYTAGTPRFLETGVGSTRFLVWGTYIGGANAGNVQLQWSQNTATVEDTIVKANSFIIAHRLS